MNDKERIVHLDLKGAPLKIPYLEKVLHAVKSWGATGILLEWEDTFPYSQDLVDIGSLSNSGGDKLYTMAEVQYILQIANHIGLEPIQLIQTMGHMEFVLKYPTFRGLREIERSPAVLCPSKQQSQVLVRSMLEQVMDAQPNAKYLHIGADEVWHLGNCSDCRARAQTEKHKNAAIFLEHIRDLTLFIKEKRPELIVLMWDDMLRQVSVETLRAYNLGDIIQPVLWHYNPIDSFKIDRNLWNNYGELFPKVWAASAFKGATKSCQVVPPVNHYVSNHEAWLAEIKSCGNRVNFAGIILTGWSRYDHYATLCELLPVALPSLASCLRLLIKSEDTPKEAVVKEFLPSEEWPGAVLACCFHTFALLEERSKALLNSDKVTTWLSPWHIERKYTSPDHALNIASEGQIFLNELTKLKGSISEYLLEVTGERSTEEWQKTYLYPIHTQLSALCETASNMANSEAGVRPL